MRLSNSNSAGRTTEDLVLVLRKKLLELANESLRAQVSVYGEVKTHDRSEPEPAVGQQPIRVPSESRTRPRRPCRTTWLQGRLTPP